MKYCLFSIALLCSILAAGQDCSKELLLQKPGTWKAGPQGSIQNVAAADLSKEKEITAAIHKMVMAGYKPTGCQVTYNTIYGKQIDPGQLWVADPYHYSMYILRYLCDQNSSDKSKYYVDVSTPTKVNVTANVIYSLNNLYAATISPDDFRGYLKLKRRPEKRDGIYFMGEEVIGDSHLPNKIKEYRWLVTYNDVLPFSYLSRREYLLIQKKRLQKTMIENPSEKKYDEVFLKNINDFLAGPETELNKVAVCRWNDEEKFERFAEEGSPNSFIAVKPNLDYYNQKLPKSSPQFFTVVYTVSHGDPVFEANIAAIQKAIDPIKLKSLLGK